MKQRAADSDNCLLADVGITEQEERAYRLLLGRNAVSTGDLGDALCLPRAGVQQLLSSLESKGLVACVQEQVPCYRPITPELAIESLILREQAVLERTRCVISLLNREAAQSDASHRREESTIEVVTDAAAIQEKYQQLQEEARQELRCLIPKAFTPSIPAALSRAREETHARGVRFLTILDSGVLREPGRARTLAGEETRIIQHVPFGLMIADRRIAFLPLDAHRLDSPYLLAQSSSLLDRLNALFEMLWERATPVGRTGTAADGSAASATAFASEFEALIPLLAAGLNDKAIAHQLGISVRTLIRRIAKLFTVLDSRSRFQAGWIAAMRLHAAPSLGGLPASPIEAEEEFSDADDASYADQPRYSMHPITKGVGRAQ